MNNWKILQILVLLNFHSSKCQDSLRGETNLPPLFLEVKDNLALSENTPIGTVVYTIKGKDPEGSPVKYGLIGSDKFEVNPDTGEMKLVKSLDREESDTLKFLISIEDSVENWKDNNIVQVPMSVIVYDENDNPPLFKHTPYEVNVAEDETVGTTILNNIIVEDKDSVGDNLEVSCLRDDDISDACDTFEAVTIQASQNRYEGGLILKKPLNYKSKQFYQFTLLATDGTLNSTTVVEVKVVDIQNLPPEFTGSMAASLSEDAPIGTLILTVHAKDGDRAQPRNITYDLITNPLDFFLLDSRSGELKTAKPLDREALSDPSSPLNITVRARELLNNQPLSTNDTTSYATLTVTIKDVNDEPPRFNRPEYYVEIAENMLPGTPLPNLDMIVTDTDMGMNAAFSLRLSDISGAFTVEPQEASGSTPVSLRLNNTLDYENPNMRKFIVVVIAEELYTSPRLSSKATVTITVLDVNDNAPVFDDAIYSGRVIENALAGTPIITITATDMDHGRFGTDGILYQLSGDGSEYFVVDNRTGVISVAHCETPGVTPCLDYENKQDYYLSFKATDDDGFGQTAVVQLKISLTDANDNPPRFVSKLYKASIDEDANKFEPELQLTARDSDKTSEIRYFLMENNDIFYVDSVNGKFGVQPDAKVLIGDGTENRIVLNAIASDGIHNDTCKVEINIRDVNNHAPIFSFPRYNVTIPEDLPIGTEIVQIDASDVDRGINAEIIYSIQKGALEAFKIDPITGLVTLATKLDYDKRNTYHIVVVASDKGIPSLQGTTELTVTLKNVNDKIPYFIPPIQRIEISADTEIGSTIHKLVAFDPDTADQGDLKYELADKPIRAVDKTGKEIEFELPVLRQWFTVLPNGTVMVTNPLDRNVATVITLPVVVTDTAARGLQQGTGDLIITIVDVNRHAPVFSASHYTVELEEEQPIGTILDTFVAKDEDSAMVFYDIIPPSDYFTVNNITGTVTTTRRIDYEQIHQIEMTIVAQDSGEPPKKSSASVTVNVVNLNDEQPVFDSPKGYKAVVVENSKEGTPVLTVRAMDNDEGLFGEIRYNLTGANSSLFTIDLVRGAVTVARNVRIDRETTSDIWLQVTAYDNPPNVNVRKSVTVPIHITVLDENDNAPKFRKEHYYGSIADNVPVGTPILQVKADDADMSDLVKYYILNQTVPDTFKVDVESGLLSVQKSSWYNRAHTIYVEANDGVHTDFSTVHIEVFALNMHPPVLRYPLNSTIYTEITEPNKRILTVTATDEDDGENGRISYFFKVENQNVNETDEFAIDEQSGELKTKMSLKAEKRSNYQLVLVASDHGIPVPFESLHFLNIELKNDADQPPQFTMPIYEFQISENLPTGAMIGSVKAVDNDTGDKGKTYYHVIDGNYNNTFTLDRTQGILRTAYVLDREIQSEYTLTVMASNNPIQRFYKSDKTFIDNGTMFSSEYEKDVAHVIVKVLDVNDNVPQFEKSSYYAGIKYTASISDVVISIPARDLDYGDNGTLNYFIAASNLYKFGSDKSTGSIVPSPFNISQEGTLTTAGFIAEYNQDRFILDIVAQEVAPPQRQAKTQVHVWIVGLEQAVRVILSKPCPKEESQKDKLTDDLSKALDKIIVVSAVKHYVHTSRVYDDWCEVHIHAVEQSNRAVLPSEQILSRLDALYDGLKPLYKQSHIEAVVAASTIPAVKEGFESALAALVALVIVLFTGIVTFIVVCSCLKHWVIAVPSADSGTKTESTVRHRILEELSSTENPLWLEHKLRPYEEQELSMHVFSDQNDQNPLTDNMYATITGSGNNGHGGGRNDDYANGSPTALHAMLGYQGSTFQPPPLDTPEPPPRHSNEDS